MKKIILFTLLILMQMSCNSNKETYVLIETSLGDVKVKLYNETPIHKENFVKLVEEGTYDDLLFHRVIKNFMIQGGDPESKGAPLGRSLGTGDVGYTLDAEFVYPKYFHKKGALAAARKGDEVNPKKRSSGCQFYIVTGQTYTDGQLDTLETQLTKRLEQTIFKEIADEHRSEIMKLRKEKNSDALYDLQDKLIELTKERVEAQGGVKFTKEQRNAYTTIGGTPHLDGDYTVFGEVVEGLDVVEKIGAVGTRNGDRPMEDITMKMTIVKE